MSVRAMKRVRSISSPNRLTIRTCLMPWWRPSNGIEARAVDNDNSQLQQRALFLPANSKSCCW